MRGVNLAALLLLGPTGAGKTPLGEHLERNGLDGRRAVHFDFGAELRQAAAEPRGAAYLSRRDLDVVRNSLTRGTLLKNSQFPIALKVLRAFAKRRRVGKRDWLILNGLPRHLGQARDIEAEVRIAGVVVLTASAAIIKKRIRSNAGGDRSRREDDRPKATAKRYRDYVMRTKPLLHYYAIHGVPLLRLKVGPWTTAAEMEKKLREEIREVVSSVNLTRPDVPGNVTRFRRNERNIR